jgi:hypothetical protein
MPEYKQMQHDQLEVGCWYIGRGRNANIGMWDGDWFLVLAPSGRKVGPGAGDWEPCWDIKLEPYFEQDAGCFQPFKKVDMGAVSPPFGEREYAQVMTFDE